MKIESRKRGQSVMDVRVRDNEEEATEHDERLVEVATPIYKLLPDLCGRQLDRITSSSPEGNGVVVRRVRVQWLHDARRIFW